MSDRSSIIPPPLAAARAGGGLHTRRCVRHSVREAAACCPACGGFFCRECVVEHAGRLLCSNCLARQPALPAKARVPWRGARRWIGLAAAGLAAWLAFYATGVVLLKIPPGFHEGTIWKDIGAAP